jgi:hypothetical protein
MSIASEETLNVPVTCIVHFEKSIGQAGKS